MMTSLHYDKDPPSEKSRAALNMLGIAELFGIRSGTYSWFSLIPKGIK
jgi:hypothetical protein